MDILYSVWHMNKSLCGFKKPLAQELQLEAHAGRLGRPCCEQGGTVLAPTKLSSQTASDKELVTQTNTPSQIKQNIFQQKYWVP